MRQRNKSKYFARNQVFIAIRNKKLKKLPCSICGDMKTQAHHTDYNKPLDVTWLCFKHHREAHGQIID